MKQIAIAIFAIFLAGVSYAQDSKVTGFRDLVWGVHRDSVYSNGVKVKFKKDKEVKEPNAFVLNDDNLTLGAAKLSKISYNFNADNRFKKVVMFGEEKFFKDVKDIVMFKFGAPKKVQDPMPTLKVFTWQVGDVSVNLTQNTREANWSLIIESNWDLSKKFVTNMNVKDIVYDGKKVTGFRSFEWLNHKDSIYVNGEKIRFIRDKDASQPNTFYLEAEKNTFGSVRLSGINYVFNDDDKLTSVILNGPNEGYEEVKFILNHKFGAAEDVNVFGVDMSVTEWTIGSTTIKLTDSGKGDEFAVIVESTKDATERYMKNRNVGDF